MSFFDSLFGISSAKNKIRDASNQAQGSLQSAYGDIQGMYQPYVNAGQGALSSMLDLSGVSGPGSASKAYDEYRQSPLYTTGLDTGINAISRSALGSSGVNNGNYIRDLMKYGSDYNTKNFGDYYNRIAGIGQVGYGATGATANARQSLGSGQAGIQQQTGQEMANADLAGGGFLQKLIGSGIGALGYAAGGGFGAGGGWGTPTSGHSVGGRLADSVYGRQNNLTIGWS